MTKSKFFKFGLFNAGSLATNQDEFLIAMSQHSVDIMAINETWLRPGEEGRAPKVPGYRLKHVPRPATMRGGRGGGVAFYIKAGVRARVRHHSVNSDVEQMWLNLTINGKKVLIGTAYRPPWFQLSSFLDGITDSISAMAPYDHLVVLGDFNVNLLDVSSGKTKEFMDFLNYSSLSQVVPSPTHFVGDSSTLIDVICTDIGVRHVQVNHISELGHHSFIVCDTVVKKVKGRPRLVTYRPLRDILENYFLADLESFPWMDISSLPDVDSMVDFFNYLLNQLFDLHAPIKSKIVRDRPKPWITENIKLMIRLRNEAKNIYIKNKNDTKKRYYLDLKKQACAALMKEKKVYFDRHINSQIKDPKKLWKHLKSDVLSDHTDGMLPRQFNDPDEINRAFLDVPGQNSLSTSQVAYFDSNRHGDTNFKLHNVTEDEISKIIKSLGSNAKGIDGVSLDMIMLTLPTTLHAITTIVNTSIDTNSFPNSWKCAVVRPLPKTSNPSSVKDLRPVSILPCLSKVLERVVYNQMLKYLEANNMLPDLQSGFRKSRGTATALSDVVGNILEARDRGEGTILALLDFSRAFDAINTTLLLSKLSYYGFTTETIEWFASYLQNRSQLVEIHKEDGSTSSSSPRHVSRGVPQGSILGPLLYILYSADIVNSFQHCRYHMYADDIQLYTSFKPVDLKEAVDKMNADLDRVVEWSNANALVLNPLKSKFMVLGSRKMISAILTANPQVFINGNKIDRVESACNLGLTMDPELRFEKHISNAMRNCFYRLKLLYQIRPHISVDLRKQLVDSLILSRLNYCDTVYGPCLLARTIKLIQRIQNACVRFCVNVPHRSHVTPYINKNNIMKMAARRKLHLAGLLFGVAQHRNQNTCLKN
ncbi:hypothetical protein PYW07_014987 [Mythimna separata]|uniref:Reverse transcriptase domain-containing protein n=1 Tax=Mythimna separata TaxID=271217 RepID=A0AAD7Z002_MYTSE|nr:hypothetical protein PYW07_014987 [Mythimna separata]